MTSPPPAPSGRRLRRLPGLLLLGVAFGGLVWLRFAMTWGGFRNSDDASNMLAGVEMAEGNWPLRHWVMATDNYYPTDVLAQAVLFRLFGFHPVMMPAMEALIWAAIALLGLRLALRDAAARHWPGIAAIALSLLAFNMFEHQFRDSFLTTVASHGSTILLTLVAFDLFAGRLRRRPGLRLAALWLFCTVGSLSDPIFNIAACLPVLAICLLGLGVGVAGTGPAATGWRVQGWRVQGWRVQGWRVQGWRVIRRQVIRWRACVGPVVAVLGAMLCARLLLALIGRGGGFDSIALSVTLATLPQLLGNLVFAIEALARLFGAEFSGDTINGHLPALAALHLLRLPFLFGLLAALLVAGRSVLREIAVWPNGVAPAPARELDRLLWFSLVSSMAGTVLTTVIVDPTCARFFLPAAVTGAILLARILGQVPLAGLYGLLMLPISVAASVWSLGRVPPDTGLAIPQETGLVQVLLDHGLHHGYAGFWEANITTVLSKRVVTSLPLREGDDQRLHPMRWFDNLDWFERAARDWDGRVFFVVSQRPEGLELGRDMVVRQFGPPVETIALPLYTVLVYDLDRSRLRALLP